MAGLFESISDFYYSLEDRYYEILDSVNEFVPIYALIDPIDKVFPSFVLFIILFFLLLFLLFFFFFGGAGQQPAKFTVLGTSGARLGGIVVSFSNGDRNDSKTSDAFGEFRSTFFGDSVEVRVNDDRYAPFKDVNSVVPGGSYRIVLQPNATPVRLKSIDFELRNSGNADISSSTPVTMSFSCSGLARPPASFSGNGSSQSVSAQTNCGTLTATIDAVGFDEAVKAVDVTSQHGTVVVVLNAKSLFGSVRVVAEDRATATPVSGVAITFKMNGVTALQGGSTDDSGAALIDNVPYGDYVVEADPPTGSPYSTAFSDEFSVGAAEFSADSPQTVTVYLDKADTSKAIKLKFVDADSGQPLQDVSARFVINNTVSEISLASKDDGSVEFLNADPTASYAVIATAPGYVLKVVQGLNIVDASSSDVQQIGLSKATSANSGTAMVSVSEYSAGSVSGASVQLYSTSMPFPIESGQTGDDGNVSFTSIPAGDYNATALAVINGTVFSNGSDTKHVSAGGTTLFPIVLVVSNGTISASVSDYQGRRVTDANVSFIDSITGQVLMATSTLQDGTTPPLEVKVDRKPYLVVSKPGFYKVTTIPYTIYPNSARSVSITLVPIKSPDPYAPFDVALARVLDSSGNSAVQVLQPQKEYWLSFNLISSGDISDAKTVVRTGLENEINASDSNIVVRGFSSYAGNAVFSSCYRLDDNYADCSPTDSDAKQVVASFGNLGMGIYEFRVKVFVSAQASTPTGTPLEVRYGAKAVSGGTVTKPPMGALYPKQFLLNTPFCVSDCGVFMAFTLQDKAKQAYSRPVPLQPGQQGPTLLTGQSYTVHYTITNLSNRPLQSIAMSLATKPAQVPPATPVISLDSSTVAVGSLSGNQSAQGDFGFMASSNASSVEVDASLGLGVSGDSAALLFAISALQPMKVEIFPGTLTAGIQTNPVVTVLDNSGNPLENASVYIYDKASYPKGIPIAFGNTNAGGEYLVNNFPAQQDGTTLEILARKTGYLDATLETRVTGSGLGPVSTTFSCLTVGDSASAAQSPMDSFSPQIKSRGGTASFVLTNGSCNRDVYLKLSKHPDSDITLKVNGSAYDTGNPQTITIRQASSASVEVISGNEFGVHPIYVSASFDASSPVQNAGTIRTIVYDNSVCQYLQEYADQGFQSQPGFRLDFLNAANADAVRFYNECYSGVQGEAYPKNDISSGALSGKVLISIERLVADNQSHISGQDINATNTGLSGDGFFLVTTEDYVKGGS